MNLFCCIAHIKSTTAVILISYFTFTFTHHKVKRSWANGNFAALFVDTTYN